MSGSDLSQVEWYKSSYSGGNGGSCVEVAGLAEGRIAVRDSKNLAGPILAVASVQWRTFIGGVKEGRLA
ncbi:DUF397 domain-containing protein [Sphaerisporangium corydalis]|uniref:DUF397 domain-containing protein n=1 Tax=Sphaerisporangium corydalis TaxID=1441875 RepID=A0ABV9EE37_9ACTN|nr:DUF397 domain-containing protein [Sphaerisporangium corydalis]